ncbi:relaxase domain-containing protein [Streptomyces avermitilis]
MHYESRAGDPMLHEHVVISPRVKGPDGRWRSVARSADCSARCEYPGGPLLAWARQDDTVLETRVGELRQDRVQARGIGRQLVQVVPEARAPSGALCCASTAPHS